MNGFVNCVLWLRVLLVLFGVLWFCCWFSLLVAWLLVLGWFVICFVKMCFSVIDISWVLVFDLLWGVILNWFAFWCGLLVVCVLLGWRLCLVLICALVVLLFDLWENSFGLVRLVFICFSLVVVLWFAEIVFVVLCVWVVLWLPQFVLDFVVVWVL